MARTCIWWRLILLYNYSVDVLKVWWVNLYIFFIKMQGFEVGDTNGTYGPEYFPIKVSTSIFCFSILWEYLRKVDGLNPQLLRAEPHLHIISLQEKENRIFLIINQVNWSNGHGIFPNRKRYLLSAICVKPKLETLQLFRLKDRIFLHFHILDNVCVIQDRKFWKESASNKGREEKYNPFFLT